MIFLREAAKKSSFLSGPLRGGGGYTGVPLRKKERFFLNARKKVPMATKPRGGGVGAKCLSGRETKKIIFFAASLIQY